MASLLLRGNAWGVVTGRSGSTLLPAQVDLVHPDRVAVTTEEGRRVIRIGGREYPRADVFHVKAYPWPGQLEGLSPIAYAREAIGLGLAAEKYGAKFFGDSGIPSGYLHSEQHMRDDKVVAKLKAEWEGAHKGRRRTAVLGGVTYRNLSIAPDEAQFVQTQQFNVSAICRIYGIAPEMMGGQTAGHEAYTSPEMRGMDFLTFSLRPWMLRIKRAVSGLLPSTQAAKFNAGGFLRATVREQYEALAIGVNAGIVTTNEARAKLDLPPLPEGGAVA
jgi:HK97 family phage portal protein